MPVHGGNCGFNQQNGALESLKLCSKYQNALIYYTRAEKREPYFGKAVLCLNTAFLQSKYKI